MQYEDLFQVHLYIRGYSPDDLEGRISFFNFLSDFVKANYKFAINTGIQFDNGKLEIKPFNENTVEEVSTKILNDKILSIYLKPQNILSHSAFGLNYFLDKKTNKSSSEEMDILEFKCNKVDSEDVYSNPEFFTKQLTSRLKNINVAYGFIDQFPFDPSSSYPFKYFQNNNPLLDKISYWDKYVNGYYWFQLLNPHHMEIIENKNPELLSKMNLITKCKNSYNYILQASDKIVDMDDKIYLDIYMLLKPILPDQERLYIPNIINSLIQYKEYSLFDLFESTKLYWHKIDDYKELIDFFNYIQNNLYPFMENQAEIKSEIKKRGYLI